MKKIGFLMVVALMFMVSSAQAKEVSGGASVDVMSNYVWRGFKLSNGIVVQPSVGVTYNGFGISLWANYDADLNEHNETDLTLNYSRGIGRFNIEAGYIYYALDAVDDTQEIYLSVGYDTLLNPSLTLYYDFDMGKGAFITASIGHDVDVADNMSLSLTASVSYNLDNEYSIGDFSGFHNGEISASLSIPLSEYISVVPVMAYTFALSDDAKDAMRAVSDDGDTCLFYGGVKVALEF